MNDYHTFTDEIADNGAMIVYRFTSLKRLNDIERAQAITDTALVRSDSTTIRNGLTYKLVDIFVPVGPDGYGADEIRGDT